MSTDSWVERARALPLHGKRKVVCCGSSPSMIINNKPRGVSCHCFRCGRADFVKHKHRSIADIAMAWSAYEPATGPVAMPDDCMYLTSELVPSAARVWLLQAGIPLKRGRDEGFRYSPSLDRVVFPVWAEDGSYAGFVARSLSKYDLPKYKATVPGGIPMQLSAGASPFYRRTVVVVEDKLSAIRLSMAGLSAMAVFGTSTRREDAHRLGAYSTVISWFDADEGGRKGHIDLRKKLALTDVQLLRLQTPKDPKEYDASAIREMVAATMEGYHNA